MSEWWEYIPIVSTIGHIIDDPPGMKVSDYADCKVTQHDCVGMGPAIAKRDCESCIDSKLRDYIFDYVGISTGVDLIEGAVGVIIIQEVVKTLMKKEGAKAAAKATIAASGVGAVLLIDGVIDFAVQIDNLMDMGKAAEQAKALYCNCNAIVPNDPEHSGIEIEIEDG